MASAVLLQEASLWASGRLLRERWGLRIGILEHSTWRGRGGGKGLVFEDDGLGRLVRGGGEYSLGMELEWCMGMDLKKRRRRRK